jgi:1-acyl-sn-glycerol-3-phosphate acyltransferase
MPQDLAAIGDTRIGQKDEPGLPSKEEMSVLGAFESAGFRLARRMNTGGWKRFWTFFQRHIGSLWIQIATYNLMNVFGVENVEATDADRPLVLVANHRSFFDMYTVSSVLFRRTRRPISLYFPVRAKFFYDSPLGWFVNLVMGWWAMYPPFFREEKEARKRAFDKFSVRELVRLASSGRGRVIGFHPEGKRNLSEDPYSFLSAQPGIGKVIHEARPQVVPVFIAGLINDLPRQILGNWAGGEQVRIWFGEPIDLSDFYVKRDSIRTHKEISDFLMDNIARLGEKDREWLNRERENSDE